MLIVFLFAVTVVTTLVFSFVNQASERYRASHDERAAVTWTNAHTYRDCAADAIYYAKLRCR